MEVEYTIEIDSAKIFLSQLRVFGRLSAINLIKHGADERYVIFKHNRSSRNSSR